jgi:hypothetical protein
VRRDVGSLFSVDNVGSPDSKEEEEERREEVELRAEMSIRMAVMCCLQNKEEQGDGRRE